MIKNIIFDFGGVIYDIDHEKAKNAFIQLGITNFDELYGHSIQTRLFEDFETGKISPLLFREELSKQLPNKNTPKEIDAAWNALLIGFKPKRFELLKKTKQHYRLFLLSNTNQIHYQHYMAELKIQNRSKLFKDLFEKLYFSHHIGLRKPDHKIFNYVLHDNQIQAEETVFIDDYEVNISAAKKLGLNGLLLEPGLDVRDLFTSNGYLRNY